MDLKQVHVYIDTDSPLFTEKNKSKIIRKALDYYYHREIVLNEALNENESIEELIEIALPELNRQARRFNQYLRKEVYPEWTINTFSRIE